MFISSKDGFSHQFFNNLAFSENDRVKFNRVRASLRLRITNRASEKDYIHKVCEFGTNV